MKFRESQKSIAHVKISNSNFKLESKIISILLNNIKSCKNQFTSTTSKANFVSFKSNKTKLTVNERNFVTKNKIKMKLCDSKFVSSCGGPLCSLNTN